LATDYLPCTYFRFEVLRCFPDLTRQHSSSGFGYIKSKIKDFNRAAKGMPFLVLTDLDKEECAPKLIRGKVTGKEKNLPVTRMS
jgi:hypothetical protein